ncbi:hypothetical protein GOV12_07110 [Candidatus Pacearchaeota archaeon]|nr:hypothetical protein [Candidatus Pacearchaeota archaeon]
MNEKRDLSVKDAQETVRKFAIENGWKDVPNIDKFDHLHEELIEMSRLLRYLDEEGRKKAIIDKKDEFEDGIGDLFFGLCRLSNQLDIDVEKAFNRVKDEIISKYNNKKGEEKLNL